jgi:hypothetical protein
MMMSPFFKISGASYCGIDCKNNPIALRMPRVVSLSKSLGVSLPDGGGGGGVSAPRARPSKARKPINNSPIAAFFMAISPSREP